MLETLLEERPVAGGLLYGALGGAFYGALTGLLEGSVADGLFSGAWLGIGLGLCFVLPPLRRGAGLPPGLSREDKRTVLHCVHEGRAIADRRLVPAVIQYAEWCQKPAPGERWGRLITVTFFLLTVGLLALAVIEGDVWTAVTSLALGGFCLWLLWLLGSRRCDVARAAAAERAVRDAG